MNYPNNRSHSATPHTVLHGTDARNSISVVSLPRNNTDSSFSGLVQTYDPHQHEPGQPSAVQKHRCRTIVALALIIWGLFITVYIFIASPDDPIRCNEYNICNNHYLMFFVGPILLFTGCSMACYNFMTYGGCCHSIKSCNPDDELRGQAQDVTMFPNAIRNYMAATAANNAAASYLDGPPAYQCVVAEPWKFQGATNMLHNFGPILNDVHSSKDKGCDRTTPDDREDKEEGASTDDIEPPPYNVIASSGSTLARNSISTQTQLDEVVSEFNNSATSLSISADNDIGTPMTVAEQQNHLALINVERSKPLSQIRRKSNSIACLPSIYHQDVPNEPNVERHILDDKTTSI